MYWPHACPAPAALMFDFGRGSRGLRFPPGWSGRHPGLRSAQGSALPLAPLLLCLSSLQAPPPSPHSWSCLLFTFSGGFIYPHLHKKYHSPTLMSQPIWQRRPPLGRRPGWRVFSQGPEGPGPECLTEGWSQLPGCWPPICHPCVGAVWVALTLPECLLSAQGMVTPEGDSS